VKAEYILEIQTDDDEFIQGQLYLTASTGNIREGDRVIAFFDSAADRDEAAKLFAHAQKTDRPQTNWLVHYQQSLKPIYVGDSFVVAPDRALIPPSTDRHALVIPQEQAFGTGSHESTALCLELLESLDLRGKSGLDIGSGSGILALAMRQLGAAKVIAFDNDLDAYGALRENAIRNGIDIAAFIGTLDALGGGIFDVITMNILPEVIVPLLPQVRTHLCGSVIVSGILTGRRDDVVNAAHGLQLVNEQTKGEWWAGMLSQ
jgi:ribosomal protein L11 methyltransferase